MFRTSIAVAAIAALFAAAGAPPLAARSLAYEDNKLNFKNCQGEDVSARWRGGDLTISQAGKSPGEPAAAVEFQTWDGGCATFGWDADTGAIAVRRGDSTTTTQAVYFVAWDGARWAAARTGAGFYLAKIADKDHPDPKSGFAAAAKEIVKSNFMAIPAAEQLAAELKQASGG